MKRTLVAVALLALMVSAGNSARTIHIPSAATNYGISLPNMIQSFAVMPHTADISVKTFIGTTAQDSFLVKAGSSISPYSPCDSILIIRPTATAVTVSPSFNPNIVPMMFYGGALDSLVEVLSGAPTVETETYTVVTNLSTAVRADTLRFSFDASDFREVMFKFLADSLTSDSVTVHFCSSTTGSWTAGNVAIFDRDPTTAALQGWTLSHGAAGAAIPVYGMAVSPTNINGAHIIGPFINGYIVLRNTAGVQCMTRRIKNLSVFAACKR